MNKVVNITDDLLKKKYVIEEKTMAEIAKEFKCSNATIFNYLKKYGIESRTGCTDKAKKKISLANTGKTSSQKGKKLSEETRAKISKQKTGVYKNVTEFGGHKKKHKDGYIKVYIPSHPYATKDGYVMEHILVMEKQIGRYISRKEVVHHKNRIRDDNRIENLMLMTFKEHAKMHMEERQEKRRNLV